MTLARPKSFNALSLEMIRAIDQALREWEHDDRVAAGLVDGEGGRAFCAGGDVVAVYAAPTAAPPDFRSAERLWREQHALDVLVADCRKQWSRCFRASFLAVVLESAAAPVMSGHQYDADRDAGGVARPFTRRGRALHLLSRRPGHLGEHVALTGSMFGPGVALAAGLADAAIPDQPVPGIALFSPHEATRTRWSPNLLSRPNDLAACPGAGCPRPSCRGSLSATKPTMRGRSSTGFGP